MEREIVTTLVAIVQSFFLYILLILALRLFGRNTMAQLSLIGFLIIALMGSAVESALYAGSSMLPPGVASVMTILLTDTGISRLMRKSQHARRFLINSPMVLVHDGQVVREELRRSRLTMDELMSAVRMHGLATLNDVQYAVLEVDGAIAVIERD